MPIITASIDTFLITAAAVTAGTYYLFFRRTQANSQSPYRNALTIFVILHTLYIIYVSTIRSPPNLFRSLGIPLNTSAQKIRSKILDSAGLQPNATLPRPLETLLTRLSSFDGRNVYVRFGQSVIQDCEYCRTLEHYALFALPRPLLQYVREAAVVGLITTRDSHRSRWRTLGIALLMVAGLLEAYCLMSANITMPRNGKGTLYWADACWFARQFLFAVLPIVIHSLPSSPPLNSLTGMLQTKGTLDTALQRVMMLKYIRGAIARDPALRESSTQWWERQKTVGEWAREDEIVQKTAEKLGNGFVEGMGEAKLLPKLRAIAEAVIPKVDPKPTT
ncbi:hypothetical protein BC835DRAFT_1306263 [Cytidiella melzeri]|nr:hypothetical protein BC835DRAFT_1306263 [Cytidiella melzeri]